MDNTEANAEFIDKKIAARYRQQEIVNIYEKLVIGQVSNGLFIHHEELLRMATDIWEIKRQFANEILAETPHYKCSAEGSKE